MGAARRGVPVARVMLCAVCGGDGDACDADVDAMPITQPRRDWAQGPDRVCKQASSSLLWPSGEAWLVRAMGSLIYQRGGWGGRYCAGRGTWGGCWGRGRVRVVAGWWQGG